MLKRLSLIAAGFLLSIPLAAQTSPSAEGSRISVWAGASISMFNPDYGCSNNSPFSCWDGQLLGIAPYADTSAFMFRRVGAEAEVQFLHWRGPGHLTESSYMAGPRVRLFHRRNMTINGKFLFGKARLDVAPPATGSGSYFAYAPGAAVDYRVARHFALRLDYEYQKWPTFKGLQTGSGHGGLTPNGLSLGLSYAIR